MAESRIARTVSEGAQVPKLSSEVHPPHFKRKRHHEEAKDTSDEEEGPGISPISQIMVGKIWINSLAAFFDRFGKAIFDVSKTLGKDENVLQLLEGLEESLEFAKHFCHEYKGTLVEVIKKRRRHI
jgi:hypothetical protein